MVIKPWNHHIRYRYRKRHVDCKCQGLLLNCYWTFCLQRTRSQNTSRPASGTTSVLEIARGRITLQVIECSVIGSSIEAKLFGLRVETDDEVQTSRLPSAGHTGAQFPPRSAVQAVFQPHPVRALDLGPFRRPNHDVALLVVPRLLASRVDGTLKLDVDAYVGPVARIPHTLRTEISLAQVPISIVSINFQGQLLPPCFELKSRSLVSNSGLPAAGVYRFNTHIVLVNRKSLADSQKTRPPASTRNGESHIRDEHRDSGGKCADTKRLS